MQLLAPQDEGSSESLSEQDQAALSWATHPKNILAFRQIVARANRLYGDFVDTRFGRSVFDEEVRSHCRAGAAREADDAKGTVIAWHASRRTPEGYFNDRALGCPEAL